MADRYVSTRRLSSLDHAVDWRLPRGELALNITLATQVSRALGCSALEFRPPRTDEEIDSPVPVDVKDGVARIVLGTPLWSIDSHGAGGVDTLDDIDDPLGPSVLASLLDEEARDLLQDAGQRDMREITQTLLPWYGFGYGVAALANVYSLEDIVGEDPSSVRSILSKLVITSAAFATGALGSDLLRVSDAYKRQRRMARILQGRTLIRYHGVDVTSDDLGVTGVSQILRRGSLIPTQRTRQSPL